MGKAIIVSDLSFTSSILGSCNFLTNLSPNFFKITARENLQIRFSNDLEYNDGTSISWKLYRANSIIRLNNGQTIAFKGNIIPYEDCGIGTFNISGEFEVSGDLFSLVEGNELKPYMFKSLFKNCTTLVNASNLILPDYVEIGCYEKMFEGCSSLIEGPELASRHLEENCYKDIFYGCSSLETIKCYTIDNISEYFSDDWIYGISSSGTFYLNYHGLEMWQDEDNESYIPEGWNINNDLNKPYDNEYFTIDILEDGLFTFGPYDETNGGTGLNTYPDDFTIDYKINDNEWITTIVSTTWISLNVETGDKIRFRGTNTTYCYNVGSDPHKKWHISFGSANQWCPSNCTKTTVHFNVYGNIMSLLYGDNFVGQTELTEKYVFSNLFKGSFVVSCENLVLPAMTLLPHCYRAMFSRCTELTISPTFPATQLVTACYKYMFEGTSSLQKITCLAESGFTTDTNGSINYFICNAKINSNIILYIPTSGIFVKSPNVGYSTYGSSVEWPNITDTVNGVSHGIPTGWTIIDYINE